MVKSQYSKKNLPIPSPTSLFHVFWLKKWHLLLLWLILGVPTAVMLSLFNLPQKYEVKTVLRFPDVTGAKPNVMRDQAITYRESIISLLYSFNVLSTATRNLNLQVRLTTPHVFAKEVLEKVEYDENITTGSYRITFISSDRVKIHSKIQGESKKFESSLISGHILQLPQITLTFKKDFLQRNPQTTLDFKSYSLEHAVHTLAKNIGIQPEGQSNYRLTYTDTDPSLAAPILNQLRDDFLAIYYSTSEVQDFSVIVQLEKNLEIAKNNLLKSQDELDRFYRTNPSLLRTQEPDPNDALALMELKKKKSERSSILEKLRSAYQAKPASTGVQERYLWAMSMLGLLEEMGDTRAGILKSKISDKEKQLTDVQQKYNRGHPNLLRAEAELFASIDKTESIYLSFMEQLESQFESTQQELASVRVTKPGRPSIKVQLELERLSSQKADQEKIYSDLLSNYNSAKLATGSEFFKVSIVDQARNPVYIPPTLTRRLIIATLAVFLLGTVLLGLFLLKQIVFLKIWTREDIKDLLELKCIGSTIENKILVSVKKSKKNKSDTSSNPDSSKTNLSHLAHPLLYQSKFYTLHDLETYRTIHKDCSAFFNHNQKSCLRLLITSTRPGEGKSLFSINLSISYARTNRKVVLVDADLRLGHLDTSLGIKANYGLTQLLQEDALSDQNVHDFLEKTLIATSQKNLFLLPKGPGVEDAGELISNKKISLILNSLKENFECIIIDTPPLITADALSMVQDVDGVIYTCYSGLTGAREAKQYIQAIQERNVKVAGIVNAVAESPVQHQQFKKYGSYYHSEFQKKS